MLLHWTKSLLVIHKILRLFVTTLTVHDKHYLLNRDNLTQPIVILLSQKEKTFSEFFFAFLKSILNFKHFPKKDDPHNWYLLLITCSKKTWLDQCLTSRISEEPLTENMANGLKHCCNLSGSTCTIFIHDCGGNYFAKSSF